MEIWLDTVDTNIITKGMRSGLLNGVTTNPSLIAHSGEDFESLLGKILGVQKGPVAAQIIAKTAEEMVDQGVYLHSISHRIIVKIPITEAGLEAIHQLHQMGISTLATALFTTHQALTAALAGADYIAPYISSLEKQGNNPWAILASIFDIYKNYRISTKILAASLKSLDHLKKCAEIGVDAVTLKEDLFGQLIADHPSTLERIELFASDWKQSTQTPRWSLNEH